MANAGGAWDDAKKIVETELKMKGTPLHDASIVGDTVGDPFKDTSSVAMNPVIKFTTLFGLLAVSLASTSAPARRSRSGYRRCFSRRACISFTARSTGCGSKAEQAVRQSGSGRRAIWISRESGSHLIR